MQKAAPGGGELPPPACPPDPTPPRAGDCAPLCPLAAPRAGCTESGPALESESGSAWSEERRAAEDEKQAAWRTRPCSTAWAQLQEPELQAGHHKGGQRFNGDNVRAGQSRRLSDLLLPSGQDRPLWLCSMGPGKASLWSKRRASCGVARTLLPAETGC